MEILVLWYRQAQANGTSRLASLLIATADVSRDIVRALASGIRALKRIWASAVAKSASIVAVSLSKLTDRTATRVAELQAHHAGLLSVVSTHIASRAAAQVAGCEVITNAFPGYYHIDAAVSIHNARQNASSGNVVATGDGDMPWELVELASETVGGHQHNASHIEAVDICETPKDAMSDDPKVNANVVHDEYDCVGTERDGNASRPLAELATEFDSPEELAVDCTGIVMSDGCELNAQEISDDETIHTATEANGVNIRTESDDNITSSEHRVHVEPGTNGQQHCESLDGVAVRSSEIAEEDDEEMKLEVSVEGGTMSITTQGSDDNGANNCMDNDDDTMAQCIDEPLHAGDDDMQKNADVHGKPALVTSATAEEYNELLIWANELMDDYEVVHGKARMLQKKLKAARVAAQESEERAVEMAKANVTLQDEIDRLTRQVSEGELASGQCFTSPGVPIASDCRRRQGVSVNRWGFPKPQATAATIAPTPPTRQRTHGIVPRPKPQ